MKKIIIGVVIALILGGLAYKTIGTDTAYGPTRFYNRSGEVQKMMRVFMDTFAINTSSGASYDISAAGFSTIVGVNAMAFKNTATATSVPNVAIKACTTTSVTLNFTEGNASFITLLGSGVLLGPSTGFAVTTGLYVHIAVIGY